VPGTTRDLVTETIDLDGLRVTLVDTAGIRETGDVVESEGVARSRAAAAVADLILFVVDRSVPIGDQRPDKIQLNTEGPILTVVNKCDLPAAWPCQGGHVEVSSMTGYGLEALRARMLQALDAEPLRDPPEITNVRHVALVERADTALRRARAAAQGEGVPLPEEFVLADLQDARAALEEITGKRAPEDLLAHIFARFCIGK
jgi:tRNA modification GTPase